MTFEVATAAKLNVVLSIYPHTRFSAIPANVDDIKMFDSIPVASLCVIAKHLAIGDEIKTIVIVTSEEKSRCLS